LVFLGSDCYKAIANLNFQEFPANKSLLACHNRVEFQIKPAQLCDEGYNRIKPDRSLWKIPFLSDPTGF